MVNHNFDSIYAQSLKRLGLKVTTPRIKVLKTLENAQLRHFTVEAVFEALKTKGDDIGIATVYRILTQFESIGLIKKLRFENGHSIYELQDGEHHDHMVCVRCGFVEEFYDEVVETRLHEIQKAKQFSMTEHSIVIYGLCKQCHQL
jgi:Fur family ferric uptake transcriptional regulator